MNNESNDSIKSLTVAEQEALIKEEIQRFIKIAKEKSILTIEEINETLPPEIIAASVLDAFMQALEINGVAIADTLDKKDEDEKDSFLADPDKENTDEDEDEEK